MNFTKKFLSAIIGSNLRNKVLVYFILLAAIPSLVVGAMTLVLIDASHRADASALQLQLIDQKIKEVEKFFADTLGIIDLRVGIEQSGLSIDFPEQNFILQGLLDAEPSFEEVSFILLDGLETAKLARRYEAGELLDVSKLDYFIEASQGRQYVGPIFQTIAGPRAMFASPVLNIRGEVIQVLAAYVDLSEISASIETARLGNFGWLFLLDAEANLVASGAEASAPLGTDMSEFSRIKKISAGMVLDGLMPEDRYVSPLNGTPVLGAGKRVAESGWMIVSEWPISDADSVILRVRDRILLAILLSIAAVVVLAAFFAARLIKPINILKMAARSVEQGKFDTEVKIQTRDELEELGSAFNKMSSGLKRLQELKSEFVFIAAHELRAPVTAIKGYLSMAYEEGSTTVTPRLKKYLDPVIKANERLVRLIGNILEIARSEAGKITISVTEVDIVEPIRSIVEEIKPLALEKKIEVRYEPPQKPVSVLADSDKVKEILMNLVSNAIKYNKVGGFVKIYHEISDKEIVVHVEDNGIGIAEEDQKQMFSKFFRAESGIKQGVEGTGLGLFIIKELVEKMNGRIWLKSEKDTGSRFSFALPLAEVKL
jgi:signal transduction histidine kinase